MLKETNIWSAFPSMMTDLSARFLVVRLESESLKCKTKADDYTKWGAPMLNMEQYQMKAQLQRETPFAKRSTIHWALVERTALDKEDDDALTVDDGVPLPAIYSKCECHREECMMRKTDGTIVQGYSYHIGSVFTNPEHRKQGLASFFLKQVAAKLEAMPNALGSVLYSDVGPTFYDQLGWRLHESRVAVLSTSAAQNNAVTSLPQEVEPLYLDRKLDAFLANDKQVIQDEISSGAYEGREVFSPIATRDSIEWLFVVGVHYANVQGFKELPNSVDSSLRTMHSLSGTTSKKSRPCILSALGSPKPLLRLPSSCWMLRCVRHASMGLIASRYGARHLV